jgi:sugar/nucleoside kinase (ribokinase family)
MEYLVPFLVDTDRNPVGLFSVSTTEGPLVVIFSNKAAWGEFAEVVAPVLARSQQYIGSAPFDEETIDDVVDRLIEIDPSLDGTTTFIPDTAPILDDVMTFFRQSA